MTSRCAKLMIATCVPKGQQLVLNRYSLRNAIAISYYRLANTPAVGTATLMIKGRPAGRAA